MVNSGDQVSEFQFPYLLLEELNVHDRAWSTAGRRCSRMLTCLLEEPSDWKLESVSLVQFHSELGNTKIHLKINNEIGDH